MPESGDDVAARLAAIEAKLDHLLAVLARYEPVLKRLVNPVASFLRPGARNG